MKKLSSLIILIVLGCNLAIATPKNESSQDIAIGKEFAHPDRIRYDGSCMTIDGKDAFIYSAAFHYFRCPQELWRDRFQKIQEAGFNTVETYIPWNWHERSMPADINDTSKFDFSDLKAWLRMAQEEFGFYTIVRPGPFICAEWSGGAYPRWLAKFGSGKGDLWLRSGNPVHIKWSEHWYNAVSKAVAGEQITRKPKGKRGIILFQIENEYGGGHESLDKANLLKALYRSAKANGIEVPIFTCLTGVCRANYSDPELSQVFDTDNYYVANLSDAPSCARRMSGLREQQPDSPGFVTELQGGWFSLVTGTLSEEHYSDARHFKALGLMTILGGGTGINYYMFFGGTHFAGWGARGMTTSYDYNAAIRESGATGSNIFSAKALGAFIKEYEAKLARTVGGPCELQNAPKALFGGVRIAGDGTMFVFMHNTDPDNPIKGKVTVVPGIFAKSKEPIYNINQNGEKVLINATEVTNASTSVIEPFEIEFNLPTLGAQVLVIPPGAKSEQGKWCLMEPEQPVRPSVNIAPVRIATAMRCDDPMSEAKWNLLPKETSLSELGINDFRYSLYQSTVKLTKAEAAQENLLLFNMFTRDIVSAQVNGKLAKRLYPDKADAQTWITRGAHERISPKEYDNRFDVTGLLKKGENKIIVVYESLGHAHGYVPMEELNGIRQGGLSVADTIMSHPLNWEFAADVSGVTKGWTLPKLSTKIWQKVNLDITSEIPRKGNGIQPYSEPTGLFTWFRIEFSLPEMDPKVWVPWLARINASGNGYMWLNGHNIGRHWEAGPQREFYLPECWLNFGKNKNNVLVFGMRQTINGASIKAIEIAPYPDSAETR